MNRDRLEEERVDDPGEPAAMPAQPAQPVRPVQPIQQQQQPMMAGPQQQQPMMAGPQQPVIAVPQQQQQPVMAVQQPVVMAVSHQQPAMAVQQQHPVMYYPAPGGSPGFYMAASPGHSPSHSPAHPVAVQSPGWNPVMQPAYPAGSPAQEQQPPTFHLNRPAHRLNLRSQLAPRVTLPWERRERPGRPNMQETLLRNLYELGLIMPGAGTPQQQQQPSVAQFAPPVLQGSAAPPPNLGFVQYGQGQALPASYGQAQAPSGNFNQAQALPAQFGQAQALPAQFGQAQALPAQFSQAQALPAQYVSGQALPGQYVQAQVPANFNQGQPVPAPYAQTQAAAASTGPPQGQDNCTVCRSGNPDGELPCGHKICRLCFDQQITVRPRCPDPRCQRQLEPSSFVPLRTA